MEAILAMRVQGMKLEDAEPQIAEEFVEQSEKAQPKWKAINSQGLNEVQNEELPPCSLEAGPVFTIFRYLKPTTTAPKH